MEYSSALKRSILPFATSWMDLENIMLIEIRQSEKGKCHLISLFVECNEQTGLPSTTETGSQSAGRQLCGRGRHWGSGGLFFIVEKLQ